MDPCQHLTENARTRGRSLREVGMDILDEVEKVVESPRAKKIKVISPKMHGFIDYGHATFFLTMGAIWWKKNKPASIAALDRRVCAGAIAADGLPAGSEAGDVV